MSTSSSSEAAGGMQSLRPLISYQQTRRRSSLGSKHSQHSFKAEWNQLRMLHKLKYLTKIRKGYKSYSHPVVMVTLVIYVELCKTTQTRANHLLPDSIFELSLQNNLWHKRPSHSSLNTVPLNPSPLNWQQVHLKRSGGLIAVTQTATVTNDL